MFWSSKSDDQKSNLVQDRNRIFLERKIKSGDARKGKLIKEETILEGIVTRSVYMRYLQVWALLQSISGFAGNYILKINQVSILF